MDAITLAKHAVDATKEAGQFVSADIRLKLAIAEVAVAVAAMDDKVSDFTKVYRLQEAILEVRTMLTA